MLSAHLRQAADRGARPVLRRVRQSFGAANNARLRGFPRPLRLRLRVRLGDRVLQARAASTRRCCKMLERFDQVMAIMLPSLRRGAARRPTRRSCRFTPRPAVVMQVPIEERKLDSRHNRLARSRQRRALRDAGDRRPCQAAMEARLGDALGGARRRLRDVGQGPDRQRQAGRADLPGARRAARRKASTTSCSSTRTARRSPSRRATASPSTSG